MQDNLYSFVRVFENVLKPQTLNNFTKICKESKNFSEAQIVRNNKNIKDTFVRDTKTWHLTNSNEKSLTSVHWCNFFVHIFSNHIDKYRQSFDEAFPYRITEIQVLKYGIGGHYNFHVDPGEIIPRTVSSVFFVNDDYEGGETVINNIKIKPKKGSIVIFSNGLYLHNVNKIKNKERYTLIAWYK